MLKVNLLPPEEKKNLQLADFSRLLIFLAGWLSVFLAVFILLLVSTYFSLFLLLREQNNLIAVRQQDPQTQYLVQTEKRIERSNQVVKKVQAKQSSMLIWTDLLKEISQLVPTGVYLNTLAYRADDNQISISGWADWRDNLMIFQKSLEISPCFEQIESPLANLIKEKEIDFTFTFSPANQP